MVSQRGGAFPWQAIVIGMIVLFAILLVVIALGLVGDRPEPADLGTPGGLTIEELVVEPDAFLGRVVIVNGRVEEVVDPLAFVLADPARAAESEILVLEADFDTVGPALFEGQFVRVTGVVRRFQIAEIERELGRDLDDARFARFAGRPVVLAEEILDFPTGAAPGPRPPRSEP